MAIKVGNNNNNDIYGTDENDTLLGAGGNDKIRGREGDDVILGGTGNDTLWGQEGNDFLKGESGNDQMYGGSGSDVLLGDLGRDTLVGGIGQDTLTGGADRDYFVFRDDPFAGSTPVAAANGIQVSPNLPDIITDYTIGQDRLVFDDAVFGIDEVEFQKGESDELKGDSNVLVLLDAFPNAAAAAKAIADNNAITADEGLFVYFNINLGFSRVVFSEDLSGGGAISVIANLTNQTGNNGLAALETFSAADFSIV